jgi:UDP-N-acetylglucosamine 1-carboxyvinyltransferase
MSRYVVNGGVPLRGTVEAAANKNAVLPIMAATLLTDDECVLTNVPQITDVVVMGNLLRDLGAQVEGLGSKEIRICCAAVSGTTLNPHLVKKMRAAVTLLAPLLARHGHVRTHHPGGCVIGRRDIATHLDALAAMGASVGEIDDDYDITTAGLVGANVFLDEASVTATENTVMAACLAAGRTVVKHAACEPHVEDFCRFLVQMGAKISGIGSNIITVDGVRELHGAAYRIGTDHIDVGTFAVAAALTGGDLVIRNFVPEDFELIGLVLSRMGVRLEVGEGVLHVLPSDVVATRKIATDPWPGFPTDLASAMIVLATQAAGTTLIHDWMYEGRMFFIDKLVSMGANIVLCDPHRCVVTGRTPLRARTVFSPDLRAGAALVLAALSATGTSEIHDIQLVERGYENFVDRLSALGAHIEKVD